MPTLCTTSEAQEWISESFSTPRPVQETKISEEAQTPDTWAQLGEVWSFACKAT